MAAPPTSYGYPNASINAKDLPKWQHPLARYTVGGPDDWRVSSLGSLDRGIRVEAGVGSGDAVTDVFAEYDTLQIPLPNIAWRWYLVVRRRNWAGTGTTTLVAIPQGTKVEVLPGSWKDQPGDESDHPLALVRVTQKDREVQEILDLRVWAHNGGVEAAHPLALRFLEAPGAAVKIGAVTWRYERQANGVWAWSRGRFTQSGNVQVATNAAGDAYIQFPEAFPNRLESVQVTDSTDPAVWNPMVLKWAPGYSSVSRAGVRVYDVSGRPMPNRTGLWMSYTASGS